MEDNDVMPVPDARLWSPHPPLGTVMEELAASMLGEPTSVIAC